MYFDGKNLCNYCFEPTYKKDVCKECKEKLDNAPGKECIDCKKPLGLKEHVACEECMLKEIEKQEKIITGKELHKKKIGKYGITGVEE